MKRIWSFDVNASASNGIIVFDDNGFVGMVVFNMRSHYQIVENNGNTGKEYDKLIDLITSNSLYKFYQL
jgi:hypothetical protein